MIKNIISIKSANQSEKILKDDKCFPYSMSDQYRLLSDHFKIDFSATIELLELLPVFVGGERHKELRKQMAIAMSQNKEAQHQIVNNYLNKIPKILDVNKNIDLKEELFIPMWRDLININDEFTTEEILLIEKIPLLFNKYLSINQRKKINQEITEFMKRNACKNNDYLFKLGSHSLGFTPLIESLCLSLHEIFKVNIGKKLSEINYSNLYPTSAVPMTERYDANGNIYHCPINSKEYSESENQMLLFGAGSHVCLGGPLSRYIWDCLTKVLKSLDLKINSSNLSTKNSSEYMVNDVFIRTEKFLISFS